VALGTVSSFRYADNAMIIESRMRVNEMSPVRVIKAAIKETGGEGIVILDSPPGTSCPFVQTVDAADYVVLVTEPTPFGLSDLRQSVETLNAIKKKYGVVINRADIGDNGVADYLAENGIPLLMEIDYDQDIARIYSEGRLAAKEMPEIAESFEILADKIIRDGTGGYQR
jgi:MinD superfamily P-loop ATPase